MTTLHIAITAYTFIGLIMTGFIWGVSQDDHPITRLALGVAWPIILGALIAAVCKGMADQPSIEKINTDALDILRLALEHELATQEHSGRGTPSNGWVEMAQELLKRTDEWTEVTSVKDIANNPTQEAYGKVRDIKEMLNGYSCHLTQLLSADTIQWDEVHKLLTPADPTSTAAFEAWLETDEGKANCVKWTEEYKDRLNSLGKTKTVRSDKC